MRAFKGQDFSDDIYSAQRLMNLVDLAVAHSMRASDLVSGLRMVGNAAQGSPSTGDTYLDAAGQLQLYYGGQFNPLEFTPFVVTLTNQSGGNLTAGDAVVGDTANDFSITTSAASILEPRVVGALAANVAAGGAAQVIVRGPGQVLCNCVTERPAGQFVNGPAVELGGVGCFLTADPVTDTTFGSAFFAETLETTPAAGVTLLWCWIWR